MVGEIAGCVEAPSVIGGDGEVEGVASELESFRAGTGEGDASWVIDSVFVVSESGLTVALFPGFWGVVLREVRGDGDWVTGAGEEPNGVLTIGVPEGIEELSEWEGEGEGLGLEVIGSGDGVIEGVRGYPVEVEFVALSGGVFRETDQATFDGACVVGIEVGDGPGGWWGDTD